MDRFHNFARKCQHQQRSASCFFHATWKLNIAMSSHEQREKKRKLDHMKSSKPSSTSKGVMSTSSRPPAFPPDAPAFKYRLFFAVPFFFFNDSRSFSAFTFSFRSTTTACKAADGNCKKAVSTSLSVRACQSKSVAHSQSLSLQCWSSHRRRHGAASVGVMGSGRCASANAGSVYAGGQRAARARLRSSAQKCRG